VEAVNVVVLGRVADQFGERLRTHQFGGVAGFGDLDSRAPIESDGHVRFLSTWFVDVMGLRRAVQRDIWGQSYRTGGLDPPPARAPMRRGPGPADAGDPGNR